jgi:DNA-binding transcriptional LysR family regulator
MRLRQIEVFHAVYGNGSISAAARALNVSQPAVSKVLRHTESQLGIILFQLVRGRLVPTDEAHALFREVDDVFRRVSSLQVTARNLRQSGAGHLRIGIAPSLGLEVAPMAIAGFRARHPDVSFDVRTLHHDDMVQALYERECDIAFGYDPPPHPRLATQRLASAAVMLLAPAGQFAAAPVPIAALAGVDLISVSGSGPIGSIVAEALADADIMTRPNIAVGTYYIAAALVRFGAGVALVDEFTARAMAQPAVDVLPLAPLLGFGVHAAWLDDRPVSKLGARFVEAMTSAITGAIARRR